MKRTSTIFLQLVIVALGIVIFATLLWEPWVEGVNANATTLYEIYFDDPFLAYIYFAFIPVFVGLYHAFKLVANIRRDETFSQQSVQALRTIKFCSMIFAGLIFLAVAYLVINMHRSDDIAGGVAIGLFMIVASGVVATVVAKFERVVSKRTQA